MRKQSNKALGAALIAERENSAAVVALNSKLQDELDEIRLKLYHERDVQLKELSQARADFADLKRRLLAADSANQFMRGYLARVAEDDTVREELLTVGDPNGEQRLVPKRKPTSFPRPSDFTEPVDLDRNRRYFNEGDRPKPRHWIIY